MNTIFTTKSIFCRSFILFLISFFIFSQSIFSQKSSLKDALVEFKNDPWVQKCQWGFYAVSLTKDTVIAAANIDSLLIPASVTKVFSSAAAMHYAGGDYRFETIALLNGYLGSEGRWFGDLIILGGGDPSMGTELPGKDLFFQEILDELKNRGVRSIQGNIIGNASLFGSIIIPSTYPIEDQGNYYGAGCSALNYNGNELELRFSTGATGSAVNLNSISPRFDSLRIINVAYSGKVGTGDNSLVFGGPMTMERRIEGTLPPQKVNFVVGASSPDPALGFALFLKDFLISKGMPVEGKAFSNYQENVRADVDTLLVHHSQPIKSLLQYIVTQSHNPSAEVLFRLSGDKYAGDFSYESGRLAINHYIDGLGIDTTSLQLNDGSGLSKVNKVSCKGVVDFLAGITRETWYNEWEQSLPLAGRTGTLRNMFQGSIAEGRLRAKTGYMKTVRAYAGVVDATNHEKIAFCFIVNNYGGNSYALKKKIEEILVLLCQRG